MTARVRDLPPPRLAVVGAGDIGRGWAALAAAAGWTVSLYDPSTAAIAEAEGEIRRRVARLRSLRGGASPSDTPTDTPAGEVREGRSLLHAVGDADWIIEAAPEELGLKQRLLEQIEQVARRSAVITSSASGLHASALSARLRAPERLLVAHPLNPVDLLPVVELVPGPATAPECVEDVRTWLLRLRRVPIVLRREVPGNAIGRIAAAVWRECIQLVLDDVVDVADLDRLVALGPALGWASGGPHLTYHLGAGEEGLPVFLGHLVGTFEQWWAGLAKWDRLSGEEQARLVRLVEQAYGHADEGRVAELRAERDARLLRLLDAAAEPGEGAE